MTQVTVQILDYGPAYAETAGVGYPSFAQSVQSTEEIYDDIIQDRSVSGLIKTRSYVPKGNISKVFSVVHDGLTLAQKQTLLDFYIENRDVTFQFIWNAEATGASSYQTYWCRFTAPPKFVIIGGTWWKATSFLAEDKS